MITYDKNQNCLVFSRCDAMYIDGKRDEKIYDSFGRSDGDFCVPLPDYFNMSNGNKKASDAHALNVILELVNEKFN